VPGHHLGHHARNHHRADPGHRAEFADQTRQSLVAQFVLDAIATKEELSVGEGELTEYIVRNASRYGLSPDQFANEIVTSGQVPAVVGEVVRAKALALVLESAHVVDTSGRPVDIEALRENDEAAQAAEEARLEAEAANDGADDIADGIEAEAADAGSSTT